MELKALEILKKNYIVTNEPNMAIYRQDHIQIAIEELVALSNRSCSNCKHFIEFDSRVVRDRCNLLNISNIGGCGDYWEQKK